MDLHHIEDNYADDESDLNIFDVIRAQDVYMQSKTKLTSNAS